MLFIANCRDIHDLILLYLIRHNITSDNYVLLNITLFYEI